jgi:hypothetical protein
MEISGLADIASSTEKRGILRLLTYLEAFGFRPNSAVVTSNARFGNAL